MLIGIDASRAFIKNRTGIEEYSYQVIKHLRDNLQNKAVVLYIRKNQQVDFEIPESWKIKMIKFPRFWTQLGLSLEMLLHPVDVLFVPAHTVPVAHPRSTVVTIHGLEYEFCPKAYSLWERIYMRASIKNSCSWASSIISVSQNTKRDLMGLYGVKGEKVRVIYEGYEISKPITQNMEPEMQKEEKGYGLRVTGFGKYLLFVGRIEERKNIINIIKAFEILKEKYSIPHKLVLAGKPGFGHEKVKYEIRNTKYVQDIIELGFVTEEEKWELLKNADVFVFPTLYEGFGIPILESQSVGCAVVAGNNSSIPEVANDSALLADSKNPQEIAENIQKLLSDEMLKNAIIEKGLENVKRFSWEKCAKEIAEVFLEK